MPLDDISAERAPALVTAPEAPQKDGTLVIVAFLGRGNAGDEAMFQVLFEEFSPRFDIIACVDEHGAYPEYWNWYPYNKVRIVHQNHVDVLERLSDCAGLIIGGGTLSLGFGASHVFMAKARQVPVAQVGVDVWKPHRNPKSAKSLTLAAWYGMFDAMLLRTERSMKDARILGYESLHGGDLALNLIADTAPDVSRDDKRALVVLREDAIEAIPADFSGWLTQVFLEIQTAGFRPVLLPFAPEDERFANHLGLPERFEMERCWWNARRLKQVIAESGLLLTIGRLHPMIFAAPTRCPVAALRMPHWVGPAAGSMVKLTDMAQELGIRAFDTLDGFALALRAGTIAPADPERVAAAKARLAEGLQQIHQLFKSKRKPADPILPFAT